MNKQQAGFTLIELVMVIVILGILAATAIPKYVDLKTDAARASAEGVYGAANGAAAIYFSKRLITNSTAWDITDAAGMLGAMDPAPTECGSSSATITCTFGGTAFTMDVTTSSATAPAKVAKTGGNW